MDLLTRVVGGIRRITVLPALQILARLHYRRGDLSSALARCNGAIAIDPNSFGAHVLRGRIFLRRKDFLKARREFLLAQEIDEHRFQRVLDSLQSATGGININLFYFSPPPCDSEPDPGFVEEFLRNDDWTEVSGEETLPFGDFSSYAEFRKFRSKPPISQEEIRATDWDEVLRELMDER